MDLIMEMNMNIKHIALITTTLICTGCATWVTDKKSELAKNGSVTQFDSAKTQAYADAQTAVYTQLKTMTGKATPSEDEVITAGLQYADVLCSDYIESLYWVNKQLKADVRDVNAFGTLTTGAMGIAKSSGSAIAGAAVLFGYAEESMHTMGSRILFELEPSSIRSLVEGSQKSFRNALPTGYKNRAGTFTVIREYISLCVPSRIEAEINNAAKNAVPVASKGNSVTGEAPKVSVNPLQVFDVSPATKMQVTLKDRIVELMSQIDSLNATQAITLSSTMPFKDAAVVSARDPKNLRLTDPDIAKQIAKMVLSLTAKDEKAIGQWDDVMKQFKQ